MSSDRSTRARRAMGMVSMGAGIAGSYMGYLVQRAFVGKAAGERKLKATHTRAARKMRDEMQALRGPLMKVGQMLSLQTNVLPEETLAELAKLQRSAPGMHAALVRVQIKGSLGREPEEIFKRFSLEPFAAASLGQVHHAVAHDGERLAVKVQYPGIRQAIENDFALLRTVSKPAQVSGHVSRSTIEELEQQIIAETDYGREADHLEFFAERLAPLAFVNVPRVLRSCSSDKVLTMSLMAGRHLDDFLARAPSQKMRDLLGAHLFELFFFQALRIGAVHADPHWGNYLFTDHGGIGLVDFGCVKHLRPEIVAYLQSVHRYRGSIESAEFRRLLERPHEQLGAKLLPAARRAYLDLLGNFYRHVYPPAAEAGPGFDFSDAAFMRVYLQAAKNLFRTKGVMPEFIFLARAEIGLYQTLHRLKARVPTSQIVRKYL
jgi:predicted unusual protein kinase regulating ubiquinone biosynthesis (AarF/ABC1/UbiB family)